MIKLIYKKIVKIKLISNFKKAILNNFNHFIYLLTTKFLNSKIILKKKKNCINNKIKSYLFGLKRLWHLGFLSETIEVTLKNKNIDLIKLNIHKSTNNINSHNNCDKKQRWNSLKGKKDH